MGANISRNWGKLAVSFYLVKGREPRFICIYLCQAQCWMILCTLLISLPHLSCDVFVAGVLRLSLNISSSILTCCCSSLNHVQLFTTPWTAKFLMVPQVKPTFPTHFLQLGVAAGLSFRWWVGSCSVGWQLPINPFWKS